LKVAIIGDVHANLPALEAVLRVAEAEQCALILDTGDIIGYGPYPNEIVRRFIELHCLSVCGNYDRRVVRLATEPPELSSQHPTNRIKHFSLRWTLQTLTPEHLQYLAELPERRELKLDGVSVLVIHGSIASKHEGLRAATPQERLEYLASISPAVVHISGHSHDPFIRQVGGKWFVNPGSVGRPGDGDYRPTFIIGEIGNGGFCGSIYRADYDLTTILSRVRREGLPRGIAEMFRRAVHPRQLPAGLFHLL